MSRKKKFETALKELEDVVNALEEGDMPLEDALKAFEKGIGLARHCESLLDQAEKKIKLLTEEGLKDFHEQNPETETSGGHETDDAPVPF